MEQKKSQGRPKASQKPEPPKKATQYSIERYGGSVEPFEVKDPATIKLRRNIKSNYFHIQHDDVKTGSAFQMVSVNGAKCKEGNDFEKWFTSKF